jgi:PTS system ascorbate-specific IIA component
MSDKQIISKDNLAVKVPVTDWKDAVRAAGCLLEAAGSATGEYTEAMVAAVEELGPYIVIMPKFALAHAAPSEAVIKNDASLVTLKDPVYFGTENDPVYVVLGICCTDRESHREMMKRIARMIVREGTVDRIASAGTVGEILAVLENHRDG